jgi:hypothetical protein
LSLLEDLIDQNMNYPFDRFENVSTTVGGVVASLHPGVFHDPPASTSPLGRAACRANLSRSFEQQTSVWESPTHGYQVVMALLIAVLLLVLLFGGVGFAVHFLWVIAAVLLVLWLVGFAARSGEGRWYRW